MSRPDPAEPGAAFGPDAGPVAAFLSPRHAALAAALEAWAGRELAPMPEPASDAEGRHQARAILARLGEAGWAALAVSPVPAGQGVGDAPALADPIACCLAREALAATSPLADAVFAVQALGTMPLALAGDAAQRRRFLPAAAGGRAMAAFALTEAEAGSDAAAIATRARRDGGDYVLDGRKLFISNAGLADFYVVFATTDPEAGRRGITCFAVEATAAGLEFVAPQVLSAPHPLGEMAFCGCRVPATARVGGEGDGLRIAFATLDRLRPTVAAAACGMAARALAEALRHARARRQFGRPLAEFQLVQAKLAEMATQLDAARLLVYRAAREAAAGSPELRLAAAMAKLHATEAAQRIVDQAVQILGGRGVLAAHPVDRLYRSVRALRIYEGTSEIQRLVIARALLGRGRPPAAGG